jgi:hypothetical protein
LNLAKYETIDLEQVLVSARATSLGETDTKASEPTIDDDEIDDDKPKAVAKKSKPAVKEVLFDTDKLFPKGEYREDYSEDELVFMQDDDARTIKDLLPHFLLLLRDDFHEVVHHAICAFDPLLILLL